MARKTLDTLQAENPQGGPHENSHDSQHRLEARNVEVGYGDNLVIKGLNCAIPPASMGSIVGPNGCGKSTFLKSLARLLPARSGQVLLDGQAISSLPTKRVAQILGILPQAPAVPEGITVEELVSRGRHPHHGIFGGWNPQDDAAVDEALELTGMTSFSSTEVDSLSGGQRQRAWIALSLAQQTDILLLDEPTTYLDMTYQLEVLDLLAELNVARGTTIVMVLHDLSLAARYSDWILAVKDGTAAAMGKPSEVITEEFVRSVFNLESHVGMDPVTHTPVVTPLERHCLAAARNQAKS
ncbi:MAG: ABC transporter ATP-binding protein [Bifidobacteriaceae bacterium]|jgi:iron complex transport system ATP-binding protein|nr:ABC transporter ATP-binding protein [Bifidobacteriaceae bacterium]